MVNLSKLTKAELQSTGFKNTSTARNFLKDILKTKAQKFNKEGLINKLKSEYNKFQDFGIDLNEANKTANKAKLATKKAENAIKKVSKIYKKLKTKIEKEQEKKSISLLKNPKNSKKYIINNGTFPDSSKLLKYIIIQKIREEKNTNTK